MIEHRKQEQPSLHARDNETAQRESQPEGSQVASTQGYRKKVQDRTTKPPLWNTKEFYVYYFVFVTVVPYMFKTAHDASSGEWWNRHHNWEEFLQECVPADLTTYVHCHRVQPEL
jgi:hypothetical protein